jgi:uncharacterized protein YqjF (DUF2071 family)
MIDCTPEIRLAQRSRPSTAPVMHNCWTDLLFLHWQFDTAVVQALLPPGLLVDCHSGSAWIGVVPFGMERIRPVYCPPVPGLSWFLELNLRTYVVHEQTGIPGVWFFSLDASQRLACAIARRFFHLPYFHATMERRRSADGWINYQSQHQDEPINQFRYRPASTVLTSATVGTLEFFLLERYVLFSWNPATQKISMGRVAHAPYEYCEAELALQETSALFQRAGLPMPITAPVSAHYSPRVQTLIFPLELAHRS